MSEKQAPVIRRTTETNVAERFSGWWYSYLGIEEDAPESVDTFGWFKSHSSGVFPGVSHHITSKRFNSLSTWRVASLTWQVTSYVRSLFPFIDWLPRYNLTWLSGDLVAGITVGMVLVPQGLSYAKLALLPPEYGLYSSFIGVLTYAFFATSKDVSIGPVAVMSLETGNIISAVQASYGDRWSAPEIATALALMCGVIVLGIGLLRIGWLVEFSQSFRKRILDST